MTRPFTHHDQAVGPDRWREQRWWQHAPEVGLPPRGTRIVVLAAHPDDETLGVGGLIHAAARHGLAVTVLVASDGAGSHPRSPTHSPDQLARRRAGEVRGAVARLAPSADVVLTGLPDGGLSSRHGDLVAAIEQVLGADDDIWLLTTWVHDGHPDHMACAVAARQVTAGRSRTRLLEYPVWFWFAGDPDAVPDEFVQAARRFPLADDDRVAVADAVACFPSQTLPLSDAVGDEAVVGAGLLAHRDRDREFVLDVAPRAAADDAYFDDVYGDGTDDPWSFASSWYERRKRDVLMAALPRATFRRAFEPGSARGDLSDRLADRVDELWCAEASEGPLHVARRRFADRPHVHVEPWRVPQQWPSGRFDLVVLSEIAYYIGDLDALTDRVLSCLDDDGVVVLVHWRRTAPDHPHTAETVHSTLRHRLGLAVLVTHVEDDFLLDVLAADPRSVAQREGLL